MTLIHYHLVSPSLVRPESVSCSLSASSYTSDNLSGKTTFLVYYLARELTLAKPTVYISSVGTYIFTKDGVHLINQEPYFGKGWASQTCLVDADMNHGLPENTMTRSQMFVLSASSPRLDHRRWVKQRTFSQEFVLNPPSRKELIDVLVQSRVPPRSAHTVQSLSYEEAHSPRICYWPCDLRVRVQHADPDSSPERRSHQSRAGYQTKGWWTSFVNLSSLMRLDAENAGVVTHSLLVSRSPDQPQPGSTQYLVGDVLQPAVASPAVWKKLLGKCPTCSTSSAEFQRRLQAQDRA
jgi:hypothetical protein